VASKNNPFPVLPIHQQSQVAAPYISRISEICGSFDARSRPIDVEHTIMSIELYLDRLKKELAAIKNVAADAEVNKPVE
jgi:hypothetical protein